MSFGSASKIDTILACVASAVLPQVNTTTDAAEHGTAGHQYLQNVATGVDPFTDVPNEYWPMCREIDTDKMWQDFDRATWLIEQPYAVDYLSASARVLPSTGQRDYSSSSPTEWTGTADVICKLKDGRWCVADYKFGQRLDSPGDRYQLKFFATVLHYLYGANEVIGRFYYVDATGGHTYDEVLIDTFDIQSTILTMQRLSTEIDSARSRFANGEQLDVNMGSQCHWCASKPHCPGFKSMVSMLVTVETDAQLAENGSLSDSQVATAYERLMRIKDAIKMLEPSFEKYVYDRDLPLSDGHRLSVVQSTGKRFHLSMLQDLAKKHGASDKEIKACKTTNTYFTVKKVK